MLASSKLELCSGLQNKHMSNEGWWHAVRLAGRNEILGIVCMPEFLERVALEFWHGNRQSTFLNIDLFI